MQSPGKSSISPVEGFKTIVEPSASSNDPSHDVAAVDNTKQPLLASPVGKQPVLIDSLFSMKAFEADRDLPIVYSHNYDIYMMGMELIHKADTKRYAKLAKYLDDDFLDTPFARRRQLDEQKIDQEDTNAVKPRRLRYLKPKRFVSAIELQMHHQPSYVVRVHEDKGYVAKVTQVWVLNVTPLSVIETRVLNPIKWQVAGTIYAAHLALQHGWAINIGGGFHQARANGGDTFCLFSDVLIAIKYIWRKHPLQKFMIIDLDAHQATGIEKDIVQLDPRKRSMVFMVDMFNNSLQSQDADADGGIDIRVELVRYTEDDTYLQRLDEAMKAAFEKFKPNLIFYIAGSDVLSGDPLGMLNLSDKAFKKRDEIVYQWAVERSKCSIVMLLGGGYLPRAAKVQADSIRNLYSRGLIWGGHKSGERTLTRPRTKNNVIPNATTIDAVTQSTSVSGGLRKTQIIRIKPPPMATNKAPLRAKKKVFKTTTKSLNKQ